MWITLLKQFTHTKYCHYLIGSIMLALSCVFLRFEQVWSRTISSSWTWLSWQINWHRRCSRCSWWQDVSGSFPLWFVTCSHIHVLFTDHIRLGGNALVMQWLSQFILFVFTLWHTSSSSSSMMMMMMMCVTGYQLFIVAMAQEWCNGPRWLREHDDSSCSHSQRGPLRHSCAMAMMNGWYP